ncbi:iron chelate uptake ABC transporter family permease subunit [Clostridium culturomicium]|uniref:iron chelate uptake ABC transporter family permease subunit n=1 Tax=Clostridium culturomicium TaxID=1499683 RepID=UPI00059119AA|nr:iron chelate uptake ABC transporter family permease subunit [Clostridium culturomicium]
MKVKSLEEKDYRDRKRLFILGAIAVVAIGLFLFQGLNARNFSYNLSRRIPKVIAIVLTGGSIAFSSMIFQTVTNNRILTPSILGLDSLYMFIQTISVFLFGASSVFMVNKNVNFLVSVVVMLAGTLILYQFLFKKSGKNNLFFLLLVGTVLGTLFKSMTSFMQVLIDPNEFEVLQSKMFASFSNVNTDILIISIVAVLIIVVLIYDQLGKLDVMLLGREQAINLGIDYDKFSKKILLIVAVLVSISTALVGQITFLGLLVVNLSYQFFESYKHKYQIMGAVLISIIALVGGQFVVERILNFSSTVSIIINFIGGIYFIYLLLQEGK